MITHNRVHWGGQEAIKGTKRHGLGEDEAFATPVTEHGPLR